MAATIPTTEPTSFVSGETVQWTKSLDDYPAGTWTLSYDFVNADNAFAESTAAASGTDFLVTITAAAAPTAGTYSWQAWVTDGTTVKVVDSGTVVVLPKFVGSVAYDNRTFAKKALDAIEAALLERATQDQLSMSIGGRSVSKMTLEEMMVARDKMRAEVAREEKAERIANGLGNPNKVRCRF